MAEIKIMNTNSDLSQNPNPSLKLNLDVYPTPNTDQNPNSNLSPDVDKTIAKNTKIIKLIAKIFRGLIHVVNAIIIVAFVAIIFLLFNNNSNYKNGGGTVMAFVFFGPIVLINLLTIPLRIIVGMILNKVKADRGTAMRELNHCSKVFNEELALSAIAFFLGFIPVG